MSGSQPGEGAPRGMPRWLGYLCWAMPLIATAYGIFFGFGSVLSLAPLLACPLMAAIMGLMMRGDHGERAGARGTAAPHVTTAAVPPPAHSDKRGV